MRFLADTHLLLWAAANPERLSTAARRFLEDAGNEPAFSAVTIWEVVIKTALARADFKVNARRLRQQLLQNGYREVPITGEHAAAVSQLPPIHNDPFDRMLIAQAEVEGMTLLTADRAVAQYPGEIRLV